MSDWSEVETAKGQTAMPASPVTSAGRSETSPRPATSVTAAPPIVLDLGKQRRKRVKELRRGEGRLMDEVNASIEELRTAGALAADAQAVILVVREKRRKSRLSGFLG